MKCKVCGKEFELLKANNYTTRDDEAGTGLVKVFGGMEKKLYDTFDCPICGCQNVVQERKRIYGDFRTDADEVKDMLEDSEEAGLTPKDSIEDSTNENIEPLKTGTVNTECWMNDFDIVQCIGCDNYNNCKKIAEAGEIDLDKDIVGEEEKPDCFGTDKDNEDYETCGCVDECLAEEMR